MILKKANKTHNRIMISTLNIVIAVMIMPSCIHKNSPKKPTQNSLQKRDKKAKRTQGCYCGWVFNSDSNGWVCAIWKISDRIADYQPVLRFKETNHCQIKNCQRLFRSKNRYCSYYRPWDTRRTARATGIDSFCYCDFIKIDRKKSPKYACAIWKPGDEFVREYHFTDRCDLKICQSEKFIHSWNYCGKNFKYYYRTEAK